MLCPVPQAACWVGACVTAEDAVADRGLAAVLFVAEVVNVAVGGRKPGRRPGGPSRRMSSASQRSRITPFRYPRTARARPSRRPLARRYRTSDTTARLRRDLAPTGRSAPLTRFTYSITHQPAANFIGFPVAPGVPALSWGLCLGCEICAVRSILGYAGGAAVGAGVPPQQGLPASGDDRTEALRAARDVSPNYQLNSIHIR
jgi:hypothetical protein